MDASGSTLSFIIPKEALVTAPKMKPSPSSKNSWKKGVGYQNQSQVTKVLKLPFDKAIDLLPTSSISRQPTALSTPIEAPAGSDSAMKKFKPNSQRWNLELKSNPPQYAKVRITKVFSPKAVYVQIKDGISLITRKCGKIFN